jgi:hypothetical protein
MPRRNCYDDRKLAASPFGIAKNVIKLLFHDAALLWQIYARRRPIWTGP